MAEQRGTPRQGRQTTDGLEFQMDEEISISPTSGATPKTPADILAGAESELEKTAKHTGASDGSRRRCGRCRAGGRGGRGQVRRGGARGNALPTRSRPRGRASAMAAKFDLDFKLDDADKPAPMGKHARRAGTGRQHS